MAAEAVLVNAGAETLERELIFGMLKSCRFYRQARQIICPYDELKRTHRSDFTVLRYNLLYRAIDSWYRRWDGRDLPNGDMSLPPHLLSAYVIDWFNRNQLPEPECDALIKEINSEAPLMAEITYESSLTLLGGAGFAHWLEQRVLDQTLAKISSQRVVGILTLDSLLQDIQRVEHERNCRGLKVQTAAELNQVEYPTGSPIIKGMISKGSVTLLGAASKAGKTLLSLQLAIGVGESGRWLDRFDCEKGRVLYLNFELAPVDMQTRMRRLCSAMNVKMGDLDIDFLHLRTENITEQDRRGRPLLPKKFISRQIGMRCENSKYVLVVIDPPVPTAERQGGEFERGHGRIDDSLGPSGHQARCCALGSMSL